jgi:limonene-1,2-epoxide hydrolase
MPWLPDFVGAVELVRTQTRAAGRADPVAQYVDALDSGRSAALEDAWPDAVIVYDPRAGEVRGHRQLRQFVRSSKSFLAERDARTQRLCATVADDRAVVELLAHLTADGRTLAWPMAVVADSPDERSVVFRSYFSLRALDGSRHLRPPILPSAPVRSDGVVSAYQAALSAADVDAALGVFASDGYLREAFGPGRIHRGVIELRSYFENCLRRGGIDIEVCAVTDDGVRSAVELNYVRVSGQDVPPQAAIVVYERGAEGLLAAVRLYDDALPPSTADTDPGL